MSPHPDSFPSHDPPSQRPSGVGTLTENRNSYLDQIVAQQEQLESDLRAKGRISA